MNVSWLLLVSVGGEGFPNCEFLLLITPTNFLILKYYYLFYLWLNNSYTKNNAADFKEPFKL